MSRTMTVRGTGNIKISPNQTLVSLTLKSLDPNYENSMKAASDQIEQLKDALEAVGFCKTDLKTTSFNVCTEYKNERDQNGSYKNVFVGYACIHGLKLEFDFDTALLSAVLSAISGCVADPELSVRFTVKDKNAADEALLESAAKNARRKAEILAKASGITLGQLVSVAYDFSDLNIFSETNYSVENRCMPMSKCAAISVEPDDISMSDNATCVWEII